MSIPLDSRVLVFETNKTQAPTISLKNLLIPEAGQGNDPGSFISDLPEIKSNGVFNKKKILFITEFSFSDMLENTFNSIDPGLINAYEETVPELYKNECLRCFEVKSCLRVYYLIL